MSNDDFNDEDDLFDDEDEIFESYSDLSDDELEEMVASLDEEQRADFLDHVDLQRAIEKASAAMPDPNDAAAMATFSAQIQHDVHAHQKRLMRDEE